MKKCRKILSITLALVIVLGSLIVSAPAIKASAASIQGKVKLFSTEYNSNATVTIGWSSTIPYRQIIGYQIAKKKAGDKSYSYAEVTSFSNYYTDKNVVSGTVYYYQVRAFTLNISGKTYGAWSNVKSIATLYRPTVTSLNDKGTFLNINWNKIKGASHYRLAFKRTTDKAWNYRDVKGTYYNVVNPTKYALYTVQVCPMNGSIAGPWSFVKAECIGKSQLKPEFTFAVPDDENYKYAYIGWDFPVDCAGYTFYYKKADQGWGEDDYEDLPGTENCIYTQLDLGETYYFQVRAYFGCGVYSPYSKVFSYTPKPPYYTEIENDIVDDSLFCGEEPIRISVWVPEEAVELTRQQVEDFKNAYPNIDFSWIYVSAKGEDEAYERAVNNSATADLFCVTSDRLSDLKNAKAIVPVAYDGYIAYVNSENAVDAAVLNNMLYAYPLTDSGEAGEPQRCFVVSPYQNISASVQVLALYLSGEKCQRQRAEQLGWQPSNMYAAESTVR